MSDEPMRTFRDGREVHPGLDADHRPELVPEPEPIEEPTPEAADDTPVPTVRDGVLLTPAAAAPADAPPSAEPSAPTEPTSKPRRSIGRRKS